MRYTGLVLVGCAVIAAWQFMSGRPVQRPPGVLVELDPQQVDIGQPQPVSFKGARLVPHARFTAEVRVLSRNRYWLGKLADVAPLDIAVGWGDMSNSVVLDQLEISQANRFYFWHYDDGPPIPRAAIESHSANWHLIPASDAAWRTLRELRVGDVVALEGELVDIELPDGEQMRTSLVRGDTGAGACEIIFVSSARRTH